MRSALLIIYIVSVVCIAAPGTHGAVETRRVIRAPRPEYPIQAREQHLRGSGRFLLHIRADGRVERVQTLQSIGHQILDGAAIAAFRQWVFPRYDAAWTLCIPIRYVDGPPRIDDAMNRPAAPNCLKLITVFSRAK